MERKGRRERWRGKGGGRDGEEREVGEKEKNDGDKE